MQRRVLLGAGAGVIAAVAVAEVASGGWLTNRLNRLFPAAPATELDEFWRLRVAVALQQRFTSPAFGLVAQELTIQVNNAQLGQPNQHTEIYNLSLRDVTLRRERDGRTLATFTVTRVGMAPEWRAPTMAERGTMLDMLRLTSVFLPQHSRR